MMIEETYTGVLPHITPADEYENPTEFTQGNSYFTDVSGIQPTRDQSSNRTLKKDVGEMQPPFGLNPVSSGTGTTARHVGKKKMKKSIFISYSPDAGFLERKFVVETVRQLKDNNLAEDIWFDRDENITESPSWFSARMEAVERCRAAVLFFSDSYFACPVSIYEGKTLLERQHKPETTSPVKIYSVLFNLSDETEIPKSFSGLLQKAIDLTKEHAKDSLAEKTSVVVGGLMPSLERHACIHAAPPPPTPPDMDFTGDYLRKKICQWSASDLQEWLFKLGIKEFYRQSLAEFMVDGFLLMSLTDQDMIHHLGIDSRAVRKKLMQQILVTLDKEHRLPENWHLRARTQRSKPNTVYLVYDPSDVRLAQNLKMDLHRKGINAVHHTKLGQSKDEFLQMNCPQMATSTYVIIFLTEASVSSPFVFHEILFADWMGKKLLSVMFKNIWHNLRPSLKAVLGDCPAIDFESKMYHESLDILEHHIKPLRTIPGVVLEQAYLNKMAEGLQPLAQLATSSSASELGRLHQNQDGQSPRIFISYQWDMQSKVEDIRRQLEANSYVCSSDISPMMPLQQRGHSGINNRVHSLDAVPESTQSKIQRNMRAASAVLCCITPKYLQSDSCIKDLLLADGLHKPILPVMLRFCPWPPEGAPVQVRKILVKHPPVDLSNEKLFKQNIPQLLDKIRKMTCGR